MLLLAAASVFGQEVYSPSDTLSIEEAVITSLKIERSVEEIPASVNVITSLAVKQQSSTTIGDVLNRQSGLSKGGDGVWATNINIRGLSENRLITLVDNNRIETATDLTASLSMIDPNDIERVEVIKGAQSSILGSGAIGGIINVITKDGYFSETPYFRGRVTANFSSANVGHGEYIALNGGGKRWYVKINGTFGHANDMYTPEGMLGNSGYTTTNFGAIAAFKPAERQTLKIRFQRNWSYDVGIPGGAAFSPTATATYKNIGRALLSIDYEFKDLTEKFESLKFKAFYQDITRDVEMLPNVPKPESGAMPTRVTPLGWHNTFGGSVQGTWRFGKHDTFTAGAEFWRRNMVTSRDKFIDQYAAGELKTQMIRRENPLPESSYTTAGIFMQDEMRFFRDRLLVSFGARFDGSSVKNDEAHNVEYITNVTTGILNPNPPGKFTTFEAGTRSDASWSGNIGLIFKATGKFDLTLNAARSYRSPALEELFKFIDLSGNKVRFGNPDLRAEKGFSGDAGVRFHGDRMKFDVSAFINNLNDMIVERKINTSAGSAVDTMMLDNASHALLYGFDFDFSYDFGSGFGAYASGAWTVGLETSKEYEWLPMIPPLNGITGVSYENRRILGARLELVWAGARREGQIAEGERATDAYCRLDLSVNSRIFSFGRCNMQLFGGMDNITNTTYTNFLSTNRGNITCEPGRNFYIRVNFTF